MRQLSAEFRAANDDDAREPRFVLRIRNEHGHIWLTSHTDVSPTLGVDDTLLSDCIISAGGVSQSIEPEKGFSTIGSITVKVADAGFTEALRALLNDHNDTINNNKADLLWGYQGLAVDDYALVFPYYVSGISSDDVSYTLKLSDTQRLAKKSLFQNRPKTELTSSIGLSYVSTIPVRSVEGLNRVEHGPTWTDAPNQTVGYYKLTGSNANGQPTTEYGRYSGIQTSPPALTGVVRGIWGSDLVDGIGDKPAGEGNTELEEVVYLDLPLPKMILALLTGDLYGQAGATLPDHWHAGVPADQVDLASFTMAGNDLWNPNTDTGLQFEYRALEKEDAKEFIAREIMRVANLMLVVNQYGELSLRRFSGAPALRPGNVVLDYDNLVSVGALDRDAAAIRNVFSIEWEYRPDLERFMRRDVYIDADSILRNNITSKTYELKLRGPRNSSRDIKASLNNLAEGIRARFSEPVIKPSAEVLLSDAIELEIGDVVTLDLANHPDYAGPGTVFKSFEVQSIQYDFLRGTAKLGLFGSDGEAEAIQFVPNDAITTVNHGAGWTDITTVLTGNEATGTYTVTASGNLTAGRYYYNGTLRIADGITITINDTVTIDAYDIDLVGSAKIDGKGRGGAAGQQHYFGGADAAQEGVESDVKTLWWGGFDRRYRREGFTGTRVPATRTRTEEFQGLRVTESGDLLGLPDDLAGNGAARGETSHIFDDSDSANNNIPGGAAVAGGAGLCLICDNLFYDPGSVIDLSGADCNEGGRDNIDAFTASNEWVLAGSSGFGWPGALVVGVKNPASPAPILTDLLTARSGIWSEENSGSLYTKHRPPRSGNEYRTTGNSWYTPRLPGGRQYANTEWAPAAGRVIRLIQDKPPESNPGIDPTGPAALPELGLTQLVNEPKSPLGNLVTVTLTATPPADDTYAYARFEYRLLGQDSWLPVQYGIRNESTVTVVADGSTYEFSAQSVSTAGQVSNGRDIVEYTTPVIGTNANETNTDDTAITVPRIRRLELINAVDDDENWDKWKGPNAEFRWARLSTTRSGNIITPNGATDLHLEGYEVTIVRTSDGEILRQELITDNLYIYTLEKNIKDTGGAPTRGIRIEVEAVATTGQSSDVSQLVVSNPAPASPSNLRVSPGFTSITTTFDLPKDLDFVGVDLYIVKGSTDPFTAEPIRVAGNSHTFDALVVGQVYSIGLISVDQFGTGGSSTVEISTRLIETEALGDISSPLTLDENGGRVVTNNDGYLMIMGAVSRPGISANPLTLHAWEPVGEISPFWVDAAGNGAFGRLKLDAAGAISSANFSIDQDGNATFSGALSAATGVFGDEPSGQFVKFAGGVLSFGPNASIGNNTDRTVTVGTGGDYATIREALVALSRIVPAYKDDGVNIIIQTLTGYEDDDWYSFKSIDLSFITITSETGTITVNTSASNSFWMYGNAGARLPIIDANVIVKGFGVASLVHLDQGGWFSMPFKLNGNELTIDFQTAGTWGIRADNESVVDTPTLIIRNCDYGYDLLRGSSLNAFRGKTIDCDRSIAAQYSCTVSAPSFTGDNCLFYGVLGIDGCDLSLNNFALTGTKPDVGINLTSSTAVCEGADCEGCADNGIAVRRGRADIRLGNFQKVPGTDNSSGVDADIYILDGAIVQARVASGGCNVANNTLDSNGVIFR